LVSRHTNMVMSVFGVWSLLQLITRSCVVTLNAAKVNEEAYQIYKVLRKCPVEFLFERGVGSGIIKSTRVGV